MPKIAPELFQKIPDLRIIHQCGAGNGEQVKLAYAASGPTSGEWQALEFLNDMAAYFAKADVIVCRSGASTVAELAAAGRAAILVPFPGAADDHQLQNAKVLADAGAARLVEQSSANFNQVLADTVESLLLDRAARREVSAKAKLLARPNALEEIGDLIGLVAKNTKG